MRLWPRKINFDINYISNFFPSFDCASSSSITVIRRGSLTQGWKPVGDRLEKKSKRSQKQVTIEGWLAGLDRSQAREFERDSLGGGKNVSIDCHCGWFFCWVSLSFPILWLTHGLSKKDVKSVQLTCLTSPDLLLHPYRCSCKYVRIGIKTNLKVALLSDCRLNCTSNCE